MSTSNPNQTPENQTILIGNVMADGEPVADVAVKFQDRPTYISGPDGKFEYLAPAQGFTIEKIERPGYKLLSPALPFTAHGNESPVTILMKRDEGFSQRRTRKKAEDILETALQFEKSGKIKEAAQLFINRSELDADNVRWLYETGLFFHKYKGYKTAQAFYNRAIKKAEELYGEKNQWLAVCYEAYGDNYFKWNVYFESGMGDENNTLHFADAKTYYQQAGHFWYTLLGEQNNHVAQIYHKMGKCWENLENPTNAMKCYENAMTIVNSGVVAPEVSATIHTDMGKCLHEKGEYEQALGHLEIACQTDRSLYGENSHKVFSDYLAIVSAQYDSRKLNEAMATLEKLLLCTKALYGEEHDMYQRVLHQIDLLKREMQR